MVTLTASRPAINSTDDGPDLFRFQIKDSPLNRLLVANGKDAAILSRPRQILLKEMLYKTADGRQSTIACAGANPTLPEAAKEWAILADQNGRCRRESMATRMSPIPAKLIQSFLQ